MRLRTRGTLQSRLFTRSKGGRLDLDSEENMVDEPCFQSQREKRESQRREALFQGAATS